ncbi:unnamed protein product (plasmid) [Gluconacetobacter diazotrophicus PA1 5]|uniref:Uncharacterized protein n=1 Tax=Gluconacetobacter diazotrophicus (strain ATCC 49037 / DSM 5601 / CCUG 37298 / CIP 103539 / LMG 7603 / PAl5) TaxID=272568 RepID=A9HSS1_GLUDA|nr:unnamed protein product [Gluconacetobacter diazotrophicus PA1 5]
MTNEFIWSEAAQGLEPAGEIVGGNEVGEVLTQLVMCFVVEALDGGVLDRAVHPLDLAIRPGMSRLCQSMLDIEISTGQFKRVAPEQDTIRPHGLDVFGCPSIAGRIGKMRAVIGQHGMDAVGNRSGQSTQEVTGNATCRFLVQLDKSEFRGPVDRHQKIKAPHFSADFSNVDVKIADRITLELRPFWFVAFGLGQAADPMALKTTVQGRSRQMRDRRLKRIKAIIKRQQGMATEGHNDRFFFGRQDG